MRSRLCILETIKPLKMIFDSAMASKIKKIFTTIKLHFFTQKMFFIQKKLHGLSEEPNPFLIKLNGRMKNSTETSLTLTKYKIPLKLPILWTSLHRILYLKSSGLPSLTFEPVKTLILKPRCLQTQLTTICTKWNGPGIAPKPKDPAVK